MNYKDLFHITLLLISSPARAWEEIRLQEDRRKVFTDFVYPMLGFCGLSVFIGALMQKGWGGPQLQYAMRECCAVVVSLFGGYFLAAYLINVLRMRLLLLQDDSLLSRQFAGYAMVVPFVLQIIIGLLPDFEIIAILLQFYIVYVVWEGCSKLLQVMDKDRMRFTLLSSVLLAFCPQLILWVFKELIVLLN